MGLLLSAPDHHRFSQSATGGATAVICLAIGSSIAHAVIIAGVGRAGTCGTGDGKRVAAPGG